MGHLDYTLLPLDKGAGIGIAGQIEALVQANIEKRRLEPGDKLPAERELAERLGVARGTVKTAYRRLEAKGVIRTRQGSGSFVIRDESLARRLREEKATEILSGAVAALSELGLGAREMSRLFGTLTIRDPRRQVSIAVICDTPELLLDFKRQLAALPGVGISVFILESVTENHDPEGLLRACDIIVVPTGWHGEVAALLPGLRDRVVEAAVAPDAETLVTLVALPRESRVGLICRSSAFLAIVKAQLLAYGFREEHILSFFETDYTTETYFPGGIDVLVSFSDAHIFTDPAFQFRNEEFWAKGGKIVAVRHRIERGSLIYIEDRVRKLAADEGST